MRKLLFAIALILASAIYMMNTTSCVSCNTQPYGYGQYQTITGPGGVQQVVFYDNGQRMVMDYLMWQALFNNGGYNNVINHYHDNGYSARSYNESEYSNWTKSPTQSQPKGAFGNGAVKAQSTPSSSSWSTSSNKAAPQTPSKSGWSTTSNKTPATQSSSSSSWKTTSNSTPSKSSSSSSWGSSSNRSSSSSSWGSGSRSSSGSSSWGSSGSRSSSSRGRK